MKYFKTFLVFCFLSSVAFGQTGATVDVTLNPMGDFKAKTTAVKGFVKRNGEEFQAENIVVDLKTLKTGVELRDEHTQKHLASKQHPEAVLIKARGKGGKGVAKIRIKGIEKEVRGTYKELDSGKFLQAEFPIKLSDFEISDINYMGVGVEDEVQIKVVVPIQ